MICLCSTVSVILATVIITIITTIFFYFKRSFSYFKRKNIPYLKPSFPLGNTSISFLRKYGQELAKIYMSLKKKGYKYGGFYLMTKPVILPIDPEFIKNILTKNFNKFNTRGIYCNEEKEYITAHLIGTGGPRWKNMRTKLTPTFTSSKIKQVFDTILEKSQNLEKKLEEFSATSTSFEARDITRKITTDIVCSTFFGLDCNSLVDPDAEFPKYGKLLLDTNIVDGIKFSMAMTMPKLFEYLNLKFVRQDFADFFIKAITDVVEYREKNSIERSDFMNLLIRLKNNKSVDDGSKISAEEGITINELIANCFAFFAAGFDTSSNTIAYCMFEMTQNLDIQHKVREEIHTVLKKYDGKVTYDGVMEMKLLDRVVSETLRKYPSVLVLNRDCVEDYKIPETDSVIEKGTSVMVSVLGLHHDPEFYPDPDKFDPERFSDEEKAKRHPYAYLPFGEGPKNCIGYRFGLLQAKLCIIHFLKNYKFKLNPKTKLPLEFRTEAVLLNTYNSIWIETEKI